MSSLWSKNNQSFEKKETHEHQRQSSSGQGAGRYLGCATNYQELIAKATEVYRAGTRDILVDLGQTAFVSSSGLVALHSIAVILKGEQPPSSEEGWAAIHSVGRGLGSGTQQHIKLLNLQPKVERVMEKAGLKELFEIYTDLAAAVASF
jgi:anti-anti-sigma regulatory factor